MHEGGTQRSPRGISASTSLPLGFGEGAAAEPKASRGGTRQQEEKQKAPKAASYLCHSLSRWRSHSKSQAGTSSRHNMMLYP